MNVNYALSRSLVHSRAAFDSWIKGLSHPALRAYAIRATKRQARLQASINRLKARLEEFEQSAGSTGQGQAPASGEAQWEALCG